MKSATVAARTALMESVEIRAVPKLIAEWEHNRFSKIQPVDPAAEKKVFVSVNPVNNAGDLDWEGLYDINSITLPNRPQSGIAKARLSEVIPLQGGYRDKPKQSRYYVGSPNDVYKYWSSSQRTKLAPVATNDYEFVAPITLTLLYEEEVVSNKLVVGFDVTYARPKSYDIQVTADGTTWTTVASNIVPNSVTGEVNLWRSSDGSGAWRTTTDYTAPVLLRGVRLVVRSMTKGYSNLDVIQMGLRLENDLSEFVISYSREFEISDRSFIAPLGVASANTGTLELTNFDLRFNNDNPDSIYYNLIDKKVKLTVDLSVDARRSSGSADERLREITMWADSWGGQDEDSVTIQLKDSSIFLQEIDMPKVFWENMTIGAIIWQIMDTVGMSNYSYNRDILDTGQVIPYFWSIEGTVWEQISKLAEGTQTAVWFDEYDVLQIKTRKSVFNPNKTVSWNFDAVKNGNKLPDIIDLSTDDSLAVNEVKINWKPAEFQESKGMPVMETVWEPDQEDVVLRATPLVKDLRTTDTSMFIKQSDAATWPYESLVNIRGEILRYRGKEYMSNLAGGTKKYSVVFSQEEKEKIDSESDQNFVWANSFTGRLVVTERGIGGSGTDNHLINPQHYAAKRTTWNNSGFNTVWGGMYYTDGVMTLQPPFFAGIQDYYYVHHEASISAHPNATFGMRIRFPEVNLLANNDACAGILVDGDWGDTGYWFELAPTPVVDRQERVARHEVTLVIMPPGAPGYYWPGIGSDGTKGYKATIIPGQWYDVDIVHSVQGDGSVILTMYLNGAWAGAWGIPAARRPTSNGKHGLFVRGQCKADFEYFYGMNHSGDPRNPDVPGTYIEEPDKSSYLNLVSGGFTSGFIEREWKYGTYWSTNWAPAREGGQIVQALNSRESFFYDEFGPVVHEMREFTVEFDENKVPVGHSYLYVSAQDQVVCTDYTSDAFGAKFTLVNALRRNAIVKGSDSATFGEDNKIEQKIFIYGRVLSQQDDANEIVKRDEHSIRRKGIINLEFDNQWIQTEQAANDLGQWVLDMWAEGAEEATVTVFGNYLVQLGDLVTINYPVKGMDPDDHRYYVVSLKNSFSNGLTTVLILRRAR